MGITVPCACGKRTMVSDALAGKMMRCPGCGNEIAVAPRGAAGAKVGGKSAHAVPAFELSGGQKLLIAVIGGLLLLGSVFYFGPMRVWNQWAALQPKATQNVQDLVIDSLREKMRQEDPDPRAHRRQPTVETSDISFFQPLLAFSMPDTMAFVGKSNQGTFAGNYNTRTGEVDATVNYGGYTVAGLVDVKRSEGSFHLVGRMNGEKPEMEMDGRKI